MIILYKDSNLEISIPEDFEENKIYQINHKWCTYQEKNYNRHTKTNSETLIRFIYSDGYIMSLGVNVNNYEVGQWIDNVEKNKIYTYYPIKLMNKNIFNYQMILSFGVRMKDENLQKMAIRIKELSPEIKDLILNFLI